MTPRTEAGRRVSRWANVRPEDVLVIEQEAAAAERERLRKAIEAIPGTERTEEGGYIIHGGMWWPQDVLAVFDDASTMEP